jgi:protein TonB
VNLRRLSTLQLALGLSLAVHAAALSVRFVDPVAVERLFKDTPLDVILVNARSLERPEKARAIAQANLAGGGDASAKRSNSPLPYSKDNDQGDGSQTDSRNKAQLLRQQQNLLLANLQEQIASLPKPQADKQELTPDQALREEKRQQLIRLLAELERRIELDSGRPRKRYIGPSTREEAYALYYDRLRRSIEDKGTQHFPEVNGQKIYGELTMMVTVNADGRLLGTEVVSSSGNPQLDLRAQAIARSAAPFGHFNSAMRRKADQIVVVSRFRFTREETLETRVGSPDGGR